MQIVMTKKLIMESSPNVVFLISLVAETKIFAGYQALAW